MLTADADSVSSTDQPLSASDRNLIEEERKKLMDNLEERERQRALLMAQILEPAAAQMTPTSPKPSRGPPGLGIVSPLVFSPDSSRLDDTSVSSMSAESSGSTTKKSSVVNGGREKSPTVVVSPMMEMTKASSATRSPPVSSATAAGAGQQQASSRNGSSPDSYPDSSGLASAASISHGSVKNSFSMTQVIIFFCAFSIVSF